MAGQTTEFNAAPDETNRKNEFLKGTDATGNVNGVDIGGLVQKDGNPLTVFTLDLANDGYNNVPFDGEAADGLAFFAGRPAEASNTEPHFYGAIFAGTDLGEPLVQETGVTMDWYGRASWIVVDSSPLHPATGYNPRVFLDFVLTIDLEQRDIDAHLSNAGVGFTIDASYDTKGVISGDLVSGSVKYGVSNGNAITGNAFFNTGKITGLIGAEGVVAVFSAYASTTGTEASVGGFVARAPRPDFLSWTRQAVDPAGAPLIIRSTAVGNTAATSFIRGGAEALDVGAGGVSYTLTFADNYSQFGDGRIISLLGKATDGVSFAVNGTRLYSGLLAGTDVGAPLIAIANYRGLIGVLIHKEGVTSYEIAHDFYLYANFDGTFNNSSATLGGLDFTISGGFNQFGLISGTVNLGDSSGTLSGLIGSDGVVGSFISTVHTDGAFAGGFVAYSAFTNRAPRDRTTEIWKDNAVTEDGTRLDVLASGGAVADVNPPTNFIVGDTDDLDLGSNAQNIKPATLKADDEYINSRGDTINLDGIEAHGVAFARATILSNNKWYAGLLSGTRLGNPVSHTAVTADWVGQVGLIKDGLNGDEPYTAPLVLTVNFKERKISSRAIAIFTDTLTINGRYDGHGLIRGTVSYATPTETGIGHLTGLIGEGISPRAATAVGAFVSGASGDDVGGYAGGFVVREPTGVIITEKVAFGDWVHSFDAPPDDAPSTTFQNQFLQGTDTTLTAAATGLGSTNNGTGTITPTLLDLSTTLGVSGGAKNGVGFFEGYDSGGVQYYYAGIFNGADLGAPLTADTAAGVWKGKFQVVGANAVNTDFTLDVTFGAVSGFPGSAGGVSAFIEQADAPDYDYYLLTGTYDSNGVIKGTVDFGEFTNGARLSPTGARVDGVLTGLIGSEGAIGVFHSTATGNTGYAGGFVACKRNSADNACE